MLRRPSPSPPDTCPRRKQKTANQRTAEPTAHAAHNLTIETQQSKEATKENATAPHYQSKIVCQDIVDAPEDANFQTIYLGQYNRERYDRLLESLGIDDSTPEGRAALKTYQNWFNTAMRAARSGNSSYRDTAQRKLDANHWPDEEEEEEEEEEDVGQGPGQGHGQGLGQDDEGGEGGAGNEVIVMNDEDDLAGSLFENDDMDPGFDLGGGNEEQEDGVFIANDNAGAAGVRVAADEQGQAIVSNIGGGNAAAAARVHTKACKAILDSHASTIRSNNKIVDQNQANLRVTQQSIENTTKLTLNSMVNKRSTPRASTSFASTSFPGIVPTIAFMCFAAIAFIGSQGGGFDVGAIGKAYFAGNTAVGSASNGRHPSFTSDDFDLAVIEKITKVGSESSQ